MSIHSGRERATRPQAAELDCTDELAPSAPSTRVLVRTLPLGNNYGGILQAYALQQVLKNMGYSPATDSTTSNAMNPAVASAARMVARVLPSWAVFSKRAIEFRNDVIIQATSVLLDEFVKHHITGVELYRKGGTADPSIIARFGKIVIGSDQVWRRGYGDVKSYLVDFVSDPAVRVISYAASFGRDSLAGYDDALIEETRMLAQRFHSISVREASAARLCEKHWQVSASHHVDPTMLLSREHYSSLAADQHSVSLRPACLTYLLDDSPKTGKLIDSVCKELSANPTPLIRKPPNYAAWRRNPNIYRRPSVQTWLRAFAEATFVVTDSFHGTIFAILNNKPFISIANEKRGVSRFESLLTMFELQHRLISSTDDNIAGIVSSDLDWAQVERVLAARRAEALSYLRDALWTD